MKSETQPQTNYHTIGCIGISLIVGLLYVVACAIPAVDIGPGDWWSGDALGVFALMVGWAPPLTIPWSANVLLLVGWIFLLRRKLRTAVYLGGTATLMGLTTWFFVLSGEFRSLLVGYWLWQGAMVVFFAGSLLLLLSQAPNERPAQQTISDYTSGEIIPCPQCGARVILTSSGQCPSCRTQLLEDT